MTMNPVHVKICCSVWLKRRTSRRAWRKRGRVVGEMPSGLGSSAPKPRPHREGTARSRDFSFDSGECAADIASELAICPATAVQIVRHIDPKEYPTLIEAAPQVRRVQVIHIEDEGALALAARYMPYVDAFLLDSGRTSGPVPQFGGTGATHDWSISARFVAQRRCRFILRVAWRVKMCTTPLPRSALSV